MGRIHSHFYLVLISSLNFLKTSMFVHNVFLGVIKRATFADNGWGVHLSRNGFVNLTDSRIVGLSSNLGNPTGCDSTGFWTNCRPADISDCRCSVWFFFTPFLPLTDFPLPSPECPFKTVFLEGPLVFSLGLLLHLVF